MRFVWDDLQELLIYSYSVSPGNFKTQVNVPADAPAGEHSVGVGCFDPDPRRATPTFGVLASAPVQVTTTSSPATPTPSLQLAPSTAGPGQTVTATGTGFGQCTDASGEVTSILLLLWDNRQTLGPATGSAGDFTASVVVPNDAVDGTYSVVAECYDPAARKATSGPIARQTLVIAVTAATADGRAQLDHGIVLTQRRMSSRVDQTQGSGSSVRRQDRRRAQCRQSPRRSR